MELQAPAIVSISATGLATALTTGTATIQASQAGVDGSTSFTVTSAALASIAVGPANASSLPPALSGMTIPQGIPVQFAATGTYTDKSTQDITSSVTFASGAPSVASVTADGSCNGSWRWNSGSTSDFRERHG